MGSVSKLIAHTLLVDYPTGTVFLYCNIILWLIEHINFAFSTTVVIYVQGYKQLRAYIATQGPLPGTVEAFWRMVWEHHCSCVVMLCEEMENGEVGNVLCLVMTCMV